MSCDSSELEQPRPGYLDEEQIRGGIKALKDYVKNSKALKLSCKEKTKKKKDLLEAGNDSIVSDPNRKAKVIVEVVFKNVPSNSRTYIHNVVLPNHWRSSLEPEELNLAVFVRHRKPESEAQKIQFARDRELDIENTHSYYMDLFNEKLDKPFVEGISRIITTKELATEFNTHQKLDRLSKTYDLFLADKILMANKLNPLPRRLGRRFWVREKKIPIMIKLDGQDLKDRFRRALSTEQFYVVGRSATERCQIGLISQPLEDLAQNFISFLTKLYNLYGDGVRYIRLRTNWGIPLTLYADLSVTCPKVVMRKTRVKPKPVIDDFDMLDGEAKVAVHPDGSVKVIRPVKRKRNSIKSSSPTALSSPERSAKKSKRIKSS